MKKSTYYSFLMVVLITAIGKTQDERITLLRSISDKDYPKSDAVIIQDSMIVDVQETGMATVRMQKLTKVLTSTGALQHTAVKFDYDPLSASVRILSATIYRKEGSTEKLDSTRFMDIPAPARAIYWGARQVVVHFGRLEPGDAIETIIQRKGFTYALLRNPDEDDKFIPPMKGHFYDIVEFWSDYPIREKVYRLYLPPKMDLQYEFYHANPSVFVHFPTEEKTEKVVVEPTKSIFAVQSPVDNYIHPKGKKIYQWKLNNIKPIKRERNMVALSDVAPKLLLSTTKTWYEKAIWFYRVNEDFGSFEYDDEIKTKTLEILKDAKSEMDSISLLTHWVAEEIRYSGISMGPGEGYTLHKGTMTYADRCGVCKDKAGMLITMLRAAGFESYAAMTMAGSRIDRIPADQFNHSVTVVKLRSGEWMLLDPTWVPGVRELWSSAEQQQGFLMGLPTGSDLMITPVSPPENHYWKLHAQSAINENGDLQTTISLEAEGQSDAAIRRVFQRNYLSYHPYYFPSLLLNAFPTAQIREYEHNNPYDLSEPMRIRLKLVIPRYARIVGNQMIFQPITALNPFNDMTNAAELQMDTSLTVRQYGFAVRCSKLSEFSENITLPGGYSLQWKPSLRTIDNPASSFKTSFDIQGQVLTIQARHAMKKRIYESFEWPGFRESLIERMKFSQSTLIIQK